MASSNCAGCRSRPLNAHASYRGKPQRIGTRTADLLHVAAALELGVDWLYSFDKQQRKLARAVRLKIN